MTNLSNRLTTLLGIQHPIVLAPMAFASGGVLAGAVSKAGGLGLIGGGYGDPTWIDEQFRAAAGARIGIGFITWSLKQSPSVLTGALKHRPVAVMLSFGDPRPFIDEIRASGTKLICQCQTIDHVWDAIDVGADIIVAQGSEAGGHGSSRGTFTFVPEAADLLAEHLPAACLLAAGGIGDGRGLAAALMLGADGVLIGTRFWASREALVAGKHHDAILGASGDDTIRTTIPDIVRQLNWPRGFTARIHKNAFTQRWHGHEEELEASLSVEAPKYRAAFVAGDPDNTAVWFGEAAGVIHAIDSAGDIVTKIVNEANTVLQGPSR